MDAGANAEGMVLINSMTETFRKALPVFDYLQGLDLLVVPFDLESGSVIANAPFVDGARWPLSLIVPPEIEHEPKLH